MCHTVFVSTDSPEDLGQVLSSKFEFRRLDQREVDATQGLLGFAHSWYVSGWGGGCSCHFRHLMEQNIEGLGLFHEPFEWMHEEEVNVESTAAVYEIFLRLVGSGAKVDVIDLWNDEYWDGFDTLTVSLGEVSKQRFQFVENRRLLLVE